MTALDRERAARAAGIDPEELLDICARSGAAYPQTLTTRILALVQPDRDAAAWHRQLVLEADNHQDTINELRAAEAKLARIAALHQPIPDGMGYHDDGTYGSFAGPVCVTCGTADEYGVPWPCPTAQALGATA